MAVIIYLKKFTFRVYLELIVRVIVTAAVMKFVTQSLVNVTAHMEWIEAYVKQDALLVGSVKCYCAILPKIFNVIV